VVLVLGATAQVAGGVQAVSGLSGGLGGGGAGVGLSLGAAVVADLRRRGVKEILMLTGDNEAVAAATAAQVCPATAKNVILLFLLGGPSHIALWDKFVKAVGGDSGAGDLVWADEAARYGPSRLALIPIGAFRFAPVSPPKKRLPPGSRTTNADQSARLRSAAQRLPQ